MTALPILEKKSYTRITIINFKYIWEFFGNVHMSCSRGIRLEVWKPINLLR